MADSNTSTASFQLYPLGDTAIVVQFGQAIAADTHTRISTFCTYLHNHSFTGFTELVPAYTTVTVFYDPWVVSKKGQIDPYQEVVSKLQQVLAKAPLDNRRSSGKLVEIPVCYGGTFGPDLEYVAAENKLTAEEVIRLHTAGKYTVYMIGFAPGFPYLGGLNKKIFAPRRQTPRGMIPAGSVGIAGTQTGVYPMETPGGWQLIGRTPLSLFDVEREVPSLLQAGDTVKFVSVSEVEFEQRKEQQL